MDLQWFCVFCVLLRFFALFVLDLFDSVSISSLRTCDKFATHPATYVKHKQSSSPNGSQATSTQSFNFHLALRQVHRLFYLVLGPNTKLMLSCNECTAGVLGCSPIAKDPAQNTQENAKNSKNTQKHAEHCKSYRFHSAQLYYTLQPST